MSSTTINNTFRAPDGGGTGAGCGCGGLNADVHPGPGGPPGSPASVSVVRKQVLRCCLASTLLPAYVHDWQADSSWQALQHRAAQCSTLLFFISESTQLKLRNWFRPTFPTHRHALKTCVRLGQLGAAGSTVTFESPVEAAWQVGNATTAAIIARTASELQCRTSSGHIAGGSVAYLAISIALLQFA